MSAPEAQPTLFDALVADLPDQHQAEFFRNLHEAGISPNDVELVRLLRSLQLYKAYYETIPSAVQKATAEIARLKQEIERLSSDARESSDAGAQVAGQVILEAERFRQDLTQIHKHVEEAMRRSVESLASRMAQLLSASIGQTVLLPLRNRLAELAGSNHAFDDAITRSNKAATSLRQSTVLARRVHLRAYALGAFLIACLLTLGSWFSLHRWYAERIDEERAALVQQIAKNRPVLLNPSPT